MDGAADFYLDSRRSDALQDEHVYHEKYSCVAVMFASIPNFVDFYTESEARDGGIAALEILNEIISGFDEASCRLITDRVSNRFVFDGISFSFVVFKLL